MVRKLRKGETARPEQFLLFPHCFLKTCTADTETQGHVLERVKGNIYKNHVIEDLEGCLPKVLCLS